MTYLLLTIAIPIPLGLLAAIYNVHQQRWVNRYHSLEYKLIDLRMKIDRIEQELPDVDDPKSSPHEEPFPDEWEIESTLEY